MLALARRHDWPERLLFALGEHQAGAFEWGQFDCATLFSDCVFAMTDVDPFEGLGQWRSEQAALRRLAATGHRSVESFLDALLPIISPGEAQRGDVGFAANVHPLSCPAVITGAEAMSRDGDGWVVMPASVLTKAYRIG